MKVAVVGATGLVGSKMLQVLEEQNFPVTELLPVASERSVGRKVVFQGKEWSVLSADEAIARKPVLAIFSAGGAASGELAPKFAAVVCTVASSLPDLKATLNPASIKGYTGRIEKDDTTHAGLVTYTATWIKAGFTVIFR